VFEIQDMIKGLSFSRAAMD